MRKWLDRDSINLDISNKCTIECPKCIRNIFPNKKDIPGHYMTNNEWSNYLNHFNNFIFSGQISDPILHPSFDEILNDVYKNNKRCSVHVASSHLCVLARGRENRWSRTPRQDPCKPG